MKTPRCAISFLMATLFIQTTPAENLSDQPPPDATIPALRFYAPFDDSTKPAFAAGSDELQVAGKVEFCPGHKGKAIRPLTESESSQALDGGLQYEGEGNLDFDRGSVAFWWRTDFDPADKKFRSRLPGRMPVQAPVANHAPFFIFEYFGELRFFLGDQSCKGPLPEWRRGEWHFIAAAWDRTQGLSLYADGKLITQTKATWGHYTPPQWIRLGIQDGGRDNPSAYNVEGLLDEFMIFDGPLTAEQVVTLMEGRLPLKNAAKYRKPAVVEKPPEQAQEEQTAPAKVVLHASFDAGEALAVTTSNNVAFVDGLMGRALRTPANSRFGIATGNALNPRQGAISFWFRSEWQFDVTDQARYLISTGGPDAPLAIWQQTYRMGVIYQFRGGSQPILSAGYHQAGEWYLVTISWRDGRVAAISLDSRYEPHSPSREGDDLTRGPVPTTLWIGSAAGQQGADAAFDELKIWDAPLTRAQVLDEIARHKPLRMFITHKVLTAGAPLKPTVFFHNRLDRALPLTGEWEIIDPAGGIAGAGKLDRTKIASRKWERLEIDPKLPATPGVWRVRYHPGPDLADLSDYVYVPDSKGSTLGPADETELDAKGPLVDEMDCGTEQSPRRLIAAKTCRVVDSPLGRYLEAGPEHMGRFALRLKVNRPETLHYLTLEVPDDKARNCLIYNIRWRDNLTVGYLTGGEYRLTDKLREYTVPVFPHESELAFTLMSHQPKQPPALKRVRLYEAAHPMSAATPMLPGKLPQRVFGERYEQTEIANALTDMPTWGMYAMPPENAYRVYDRYTAFLANTAQNLVDLPYAWYGGPGYPSPTEEFNHDQFVGRGLHYLMELAEQRGIKVLPQLTMMTAHPLAVATAEFRGPAYDNPLLQVAWDGTAVTKPAYGTPMFNPLHPEVRKVFREQLEDLMILYGQEPALGGVALVGSGWASTWFVNITRDYSDYTVGLFEKETGIQVPTSKGIQRFSVRYRFLIDARNREKWVAWRCRKIKEFYDSLADVIRKYRPELKLYASVYPVSDADADAVILRGVPLKQCYREAGIDPDLYVDDEKVTIRFEYNIDALRSLRIDDHFNPTLYQPMRDLAYLPEGFSSLVNGRNSLMTFHRLYFENFPFWGYFGKAPELPGLWITDRLRLPEWQSGLYHTPAALGRNFLKQFALALADSDTVMIAHGGISPILGHERELREFGMAFRALPALRFTDFAGMENPVRLRTLSAEGRLFLALVNREPYPLAVELRLKKPAELTDLGAKTPVASTAPKTYRIQLDAYQLRALATDKRNELASAAANVPEPERTALQNRVRTLEELLAKDSGTEKEHPQAVEMVTRLKRSLADGHYSLARLLCEGTIMRRLEDRCQTAK